MAEKVFFMNGILKETPDGPWPYFVRCKKCGKTFFPAEPVCNACLSEDLEEVLLPKYGSIRTFTVFYRKVNAYPAPHCLAQVNFPEERLVVYGQLVPKDPAKLEKLREFKIGAKVETIVDTLWTEDGKEYIGYKFKVLE
ncbi:MAG: Zn-ribbon domain-containing OB-fold protein [Oscillospiraceae bacterium]|jgi:uncharacterized OB-fold protein